MDKSAIDKAMKEGLAAYMATIAGITGADPETLKTQFVTMCIDNMGQPKKHILEAAGVDGARRLAGHYYTRARKAEDESRRAQIDLIDAKDEINRLNTIISKIQEAIGNE